MAMRYGYVSETSVIPQWVIILNLADQYHTPPWEIAPNRSMMYWLNKRGIYLNIKQRVQDDIEDEGKRNR